MVQDSFFYHFLIWRTPFSQFVRVGLLATPSIFFCLRISLFPFIPHWIQYSWLTVLFFQHLQNLGSVQPLFLKILFQLYSLSHILLGFWWWIYCYCPTGSWGPVPFFFQSILSLLLRVNPIDLPQDYWFLSSVISTLLLNQSSEFFYFSCCIL